MEKDALGPKKKLAITKITNLVAVWTEVTTRNEGKHCNTRYQKLKVLLDFYFFKFWTESIMMSFYIYSGNSHLDDFKILKRNVSNFIALR